MLVVGQKFRTVQTHYFKRFKEEPVACVTVKDEWAIDGKSTYAKNNELPGLMTALKSLKDDLSTPLGEMEFQLVLFHVDKTDPNNPVYKVVGVHQPLKSERTIFIGLAKIVENDKLQPNYGLNIPIELYDSLVTLLDAKAIPIAKALQDHLNKTVI